MQRALDWRGEKSLINFYTPKDMLRKSDNNFQYLSIFNSKGKIDEKHLDFGGVFCVLFLLNLVSWTRRRCQF